MTIGHDESLEDYEERFQLSYKRARCTLDPKSLKLVLLRGVREDILDTLHMLAGGYIYQLPYDDTKSIFRNHSRATRNNCRSSQPMASTSSSNSSIKGQIGNMLEDFKSEMLQTISLQLDTMNIRRKQEEEERALAIFCPRCTRRHPMNEFPLNCIEIFLVCEKNHSTKKFPSLPGLKAVYQGAKGATEQLCYINQRDLLGLDHSRRVCKDHAMHVIDPTKPQLHLLGDPLLIPPGLHPLLGPMHLSTIPSKPTDHFNLIISHNISGIPHLRGGSPNSTMLHLYCLHHLPNHNSCTLLHLGNPRCSPSEVQTETIGRLNKHTMERHHTQLMLLKFRR